MIVVDTNVLLYAANAAAAEHQAAASWLDHLRTGTRPFHLTWGIVYEYLRVASHRRFEATLAGGRALELVVAIMASRAASILVESERHLEVVEAVLSSDSNLRGSVIHDVHTVALMREHGVSRILTRDRDFERFDDLDVIDPTTTVPAA